MAPLCSNRNSTEILSTKGWAYCMQFPIWDIVWMAPTSCWIQCRKQHWKSGLGFQGLWVRNIEHQDNSEIKEFYTLVWARILRSRQNQRKLLEWHVSNCFKLAEQKALEKTPITDSQSQFSMLKIIRNFLNFFFIEEYQFRGIFALIDIFWKLQFLNHFIF